MLFTFKKVYFFVYFCALITFAKVLNIAQSKIAVWGVSLFNNSQIIFNMSYEIEHKYLVKNSDYKVLAVEKHHIIQGYLSDAVECTIRVRIFDDRAYVTIKGKNYGAKRLEYEYEIPINEAREMLNLLCKKPILEKYRYIVISQGNRWEVDEFCGKLAGLTLAEIEIPSENYMYEKPDFIGKDVTSDARYYNSQLAISGKIPD